MDLCFDRFVVDDLRFRAFEEYDRSKEALHGHAIEVQREGKLVRRTVPRGDCRRTLTGQRRPRREGPGSPARM